MSLVPTRDEIIREARHGLVVKLRLEQGCTYQEISDRIGLSISQCQRVYEAARARRRGDLDIERHMDDQYADIEGALEMVRPFVFGAPAPPDFPVMELKDAYDQFWKGVDRKSKLLGLDAPSRSHLMHEDLNQTVDMEAADKLARLALWAQKHNAINVDGFEPALPPGMTERVDPNSNGHMNGYQTKGSPGTSMWSMVLEFPHAEG